MHAPEICATSDEGGVTVNAARITWAFTTTPGTGNPIRTSSGITSGPSALSAPDSSPSPRPAALSSLLAQDNNTQRLHEYD